MLLLLSCITTTSCRWRLGSGRGDCCPLVLRLLLLLASCWLAVSLAFNRRRMDLCSDGNNLLVGRGCFSLAPAAAPTIVADPLALGRHTSAMLTARWLKWSYNALWPTGPLLYCASSRRLAKRNRNVTQTLHALLERYRNARQTLWKRRERQLGARQTSGR